MAAKPKEIEAKDINFMNYDLKIILIEQMLGTIPKNKDVYARFIATKLQGITEGQLNEEIEGIPEEIENTGWTGFRTDNNGIFVYDYFIKGFLKEAGNILKDSLGVPALRSKIDNLVFVFPRKIYIGEKPDGLLERPIRVQTMQGPRVSVVRSDFVNEGTIINCSLKVIGSRVINEKILRSILDYGSLKGLGQFRNGSYGRFNYELISKGVSPFSK